MGRPPIFTLESLQQHALDKGGKCLSETYLKGRDKYEWECALGHKWHTTWYDIRRGAWCHECALKTNGERISEFKGSRRGKSKFSIQDLKAYAVSKGGVCVSVNYAGGRSRQTWRCSEGHIWEAQWFEIKQGGWCPECQVESRKHAESQGWLEALASERGGSFVSGDYNSNKSKILWRCSEGHEWKSKPNQLQQGQWCPNCAGNIEKTLEDYRSLALSRGFMYLSDKAIFTHERSEWQCSAGHMWTITYGDVKQGYGCPHCAGNVPKTVVDFRELAELRGFSFLSAEVKNTKENYGWRCSKGHEWLACYSNIRAGTSCPHCAGHISKPQIELFEYIKSLVPGEEVLLSDRVAIKPLELDICVPSRNFALEYDGLIWHSSWAEPYVPSRHQTKALACRSAGIGLLAIFGDEWESKPELIKAMIRYRLGKFEGTKLNARSLELRRLDKNAQFEEFFQRNHIDGHTMAQYAYGLFLSERLVMCATVRTNHQGESEIGRLATDYDYSVRGGGARLVAAIRKEVSGVLVSYSNNRLSSGGIYAKLGFVKLQENAPSYYYTDGQVRLWRYKCKRINTPEILAQFPTEKAQAIGGVFSRMYLGHDNPMYQIHDYGHQKFQLG